MRCWKTQGQINHQCTGSSLWFKTQLVSTSSSNNYKIQKNAPCYITNKKILQKRWIESIVDFKFLLSIILQLRNLADSNAGSKIKETTTICFCDGLKTMWNTIWQYDGFWTSTWNTQQSNPNKDDEIPAGNPTLQSIQWQ